MKAHIVDSGALRAISPLALSAYARAEGWVYLEGYGEHSDIYVRSDVGEIIIPGTEALGDYDAVVASILESFAKAEGRDELSVYRDLVGADRDVVRVRSPEADGDGSVRIDAGVDLVSHARDLLLSAACAATEPRPTYRAGRIKEAAVYMDRVRLGQTEHGSFVVTLLAPVPPKLDVQDLQGQLWPALDVEPYDRLVTRRLADGLEAARTAAERAIRGDSAKLEPFKQAVPQGVSANLCEALTHLIERGEGLEVSVTWAKTRAAPEPRRKITFSRSDGEVFREAARLFRSSEPRPDEKVEGFVIKCDRQPSEQVGRVTVRTLLDGQPISVRAELPASLYSTALEAHDRKQAIAMVGDLDRLGQRWHLTKPHDLVILEAADDESSMI